jgi:hypothetical protein
MSLQTQERPQTTQANSGFGSTLWNSIRGAFTVVQDSVTQFFRGVEDDNSASQPGDEFSQETTTTSNSGSSSSGGTSASLTQVIEDTSQKEDILSTSQLQQENVDLTLDLEALTLTDRPEFQAIAELDLRTISEPQPQEQYDQLPAQRFEEQTIQDVERATRPEVVQQQQVEQLHQEVIKLEPQLYPQVQPEVAKLDQLDQHVQPQIQPEVKGLDQPVTPQIQPPDLQAKAQPIQPPASPTPAQPVFEPKIDEPVSKDYEQPNAEVVERLNSLLDHKPKGKLVAETTWVASADPVMSVYHRAAAEVTRVTNFSSKHARYESLVAAKLIHEVGYNKAAEALAAGSPKLNHINRTEGARAAATYLQEQLHEGRAIVQSVQQPQQAPQRQLRKPTS